MKGFEYDKDQYVIMTDDDFEKIKTEKDKTIQILHFANLNQISPVYYDKTYQAVPDVGGEKAFELLRRAMMEQQKIAIGKTVMGTAETLLAIIPREDGILIEKMFYQDEIKDIPKAYAHPEVSVAELTMAKTLIDNMDKPFDPAIYITEVPDMIRTSKPDKHLIKRYRWQKRLILAACAGAILLVASLLNLAAVAVVQHYEHKPTVYEFRYTYSDRGNLERFDRLVSD